MSTVTSYTLLSGRPAALPANSSGSRIQYGRPAVVALPSFQMKSRPLSMCCANPKAEHNPQSDLPAFSISPVVLVNPVPHARGEERWQLEEKAGVVSLTFEVPGLSKDDLVVEIDEDVLVIKKMAKVDNDKGQSYQSKAQERPVTDESGVVYARLLIPAGYSKENVNAELKSGVLTVNITKIKEHARRKIKVNIVDAK